VFFSIVERQALRRGDFAGVTELLVMRPRRGGQCLLPAGMGDPYRQDALLTGLVAQPLRCISHRNDGLIQVIRLSEKGGRKRWAASAGAAMAGAYAW